MSRHCSVSTSLGTCSHHVTATMLLLLLLQFFFMYACMSVTMHQQILHHCLVYVCFFEAIVCACVRAWIKVTQLPRKCHCLYKLHNTVLENFTAFIFFNGNACTCVSAWPLSVLTIEFPVICTCEQYKHVDKAIGLVYGDDISASYALFITEYLFFI